MITEEPYVKFMIKHRLTQTQFLLLHLIYKSRVDLIKEYKNAFPTEDGSMIPQYLVDDLINRNFMVKTTNGYKLGKKFVEAYANKHTITDEIYNIYPSFIISNGVNIPLTAMDRIEFANIYIGKINGSIDEHNEVLKDIKFAIKEDLITIGLTKFLQSEQWKAFRPLRKESESTAITSNTYTDF